MQLYDFARHDDDGYTHHDHLQAVYERRFLLAASALGTELDNRGTDYVAETTVYNFLHAWRHWYDLG